MPTPAPQLGLRAGRAIIPPTVPSSCQGWALQPFQGPALPTSIPHSSHGPAKTGGCTEGTSALHLVLFQRFFGSKKKTKNPTEKELGKMVISNLPDEDFKVVVIKMLAELRRKVDKHSENFRREKI